MDWGILSGWIATGVLLLSSLVAINKSIRASAAAETSRKLWEKKVEEETEKRNVVVDTKFGEMKTSMDKKLTDMKETVDSRFEEIKHILGNGAYHGIRQDIAEIKLNCASKMAEVITKVDAHLEAPKPRRKR